MKINKVTIKNINSLKGEFTIDFTQFEEEGLFAITGPTGAGKSTILDAVTLALFGKTPRLKNASQEIMSKHTGESLSECEFEVDGEIYISSFSQNRAYLKPNGKIRPAKMKLFKKDGEILETGLSLVPKKVEEITGLDFNRFIRSVLLAQGNFDAFLKAKDSEKAELLEKMTSTKIYAEISVKVFEKTKELQKECEIAKEKMRALSVLEKEEEERYKKILKEKSEKSTLLKSTIEKLRGKERILKREREIREALKEKEAQKEKLAKERESLKSRLLLLEKAYLARENKTIYEKLKEKEKSLKDSEKSAKTLKREIDLIRTKLKGMLFEANERLKEKLKEEKRYESLLKSEREELKKLSNLVSKKNLQTLMKEKEKIVKEREKLKSLKEKAKRFENLKKEREKLKNELKLLRKEAERNRELIEREREKKKFTEEALKMIEKRMELENKIINYEKERAKLKEGEPCPLCGSLHHPFVNSLELPSLSKTEKELSLKKEELKKSLDRLNELIINEQRIKSDEKNKKDSLERIEKEINENLGEEFPKSLLEIEEKLNSLREKYERVEKETKELYETEKIIEEKRKKTAFYEKEILSLKTETEIVKEILKKREIEKTSKKFEEKTNLKELTKLISKTERDEELKIKLLEKIVEETEKREKEKKFLKEEFLKRLKERGFETIEEFEKHLLKEEEIKEAEKLKESVQKREIETESAVKYLENELKLLNIKGDENLEEIESLLKEKEREFENLRSEIVKIETVLEENEKNLKKMKELKNAYEEILKEYKLHSRLNDLIGSSRGDKFRKFAQSLTFEFLVKLANSHLKRLTDRYVLKRTPNTLSFSVADAYQANALRSVNTLSGGESFMVSLALALALCDLLSRKVKIKTLFLDEGFGTLDSETLESVLSALNSVKSGGKTIGVISHVEALKERIAREIRVVKLSGGVSKIEIV